MHRFARLLLAFSKDERGQTAIEYGLIVGVCAVAIVTALTGFGESVANTFNSLVPAFP